MTDTRLAQLALSLAATLLCPALASANQPDVIPTYHGEDESVVSAVELTLEGGLLDRGTTGVGEPLLGYGYDHGGGVLIGAGLRLYFDIDGRYFHHGVAVRVGHQPGGGFAWSQLDLTYVFRTELPCLSSDDRRLRLSGIIGVTGARADAGMGNGAADDRWNLREVASEQLDHQALGAVLGVALDVHSGPFLLGLMLDVRELFALGDTPVARSFVATGSLRAGVELDL